MKLKIIRRLSACGVTQSVTSGWIDTVMEGSIIRNVPVTFTIDDDKMFNIAVNIPKVRASINFKSVQ